jgi:excisionase family DNA binding protein
MSRTKKKPASQPQNGPPALPAEVLTLTEAAAYLRLAEADVLRLIREQALPGRAIGPNWRFLKAALQDWLRSAPEKKRLFRHIGALPNDPQTEEMLEETYRRRRLQVEEA